MLKFVAESIENFNRGIREALAKRGELYSTCEQATARAVDLTRAPGGYAPGTGQAGVDAAKWVVRLMYFPDQPIGVMENAQTPGEPVTVNVSPVCNNRTVPEGWTTVFQGFDYPPDVKVRAKPGYEPLLDVLLQMLEHAQSGKGHERHGTDEDIRDQRAVQDALTLGSIQGPVYQVMKKVAEASRLAARGDYETARRNLLGAGNYAAFAVMVLDILTTAKP